MPVISVRSPVCLSVFARVEGLKLHFLIDPVLVPSVVVVAGLWSRSLAIEALEYLFCSFLRGPLSSFLLNIPIQRGERLTLELAVADETQYLQTSCREHPPANRGHSDDTGSGFDTHLAMPPLLIVLRQT